jgi:hypothetical protein
VVDAAFQRRLARALAQRVVQGLWQVALQARVDCVQPGAGGCVHIWRSPILGALEQSGRCLCAQARPIIIA